MSAADAHTLQEADPSESEMETLFSAMVGARIITRSGIMTTVALPEIKYAATVVKNSGALNDITEWRDEDREKNYRGGRPSLIPPLAVLAALLILAQERSPLLFTNVRNLLQFRLSHSARAYLDVPEHMSGPTDWHVKKNWYNNAYESWRRILATMDSFDGQRNILLNRAEREELLSLRDRNMMRRKKERLDRFSNMLIDITLQSQPRHLRRRSPKMNLSIDQTPIPAVSQRTRSRREKRGPNKGKEVKDVKVLETEADFYPMHTKFRPNPDAAPKMDFIWAYAANIAVQVPEDPNGPAIPRLVAGFTLSTPNQDLAGETITILKSVVTDRNHAPGRAGGDRSYFGMSAVDKLHTPARALGFSVITDYPKDALGYDERRKEGGGKAGLLFVEGLNLCPATPKPLVNATVDNRKTGDDAIDQETYWKRLKERQLYAARPKEKPDERGHQPMMCPAVGPNPTIECPWRELHHGAPNKARPQVLEANLPKVKDRICTQTSVDFGPEDNLKQRQDFVFGDQVWERTYRHDRNSIESTNAQFKDSAHENAGAPGRRRVRGLAAQQIMLTFMLVAYNFRRLAAFLEDEKDKSENQHLVPKKSRRRDRLGDSHYTRASRKKRGAPEKDDSPPVVL